MRCSRKKTQAEVLVSVSPALLQSKIQGFRGFGVLGGFGGKPCDNISICSVVMLTIVGAAIRQVQTVNPSHGPSKLKVCIPSTVSSEAIHKLSIQKVMALNPKPYYIGIDLYMCVYTYIYTRTYILKKFMCIYICTFVDVYVHGYCCVVTSTSSFVVCSFFL